MLLYYWHGKGIWAWLIRTWTKSKWSHVALSCQIDGLECYLEAYPGVGVRLVPLSFNPPDGYQKVGRRWRPYELGAALMSLGVPYSRFNAAMAGLGMRSYHRGQECAQLVSHILRIDVVPTPEMVAVEVALETGNPVRHWDKTVKEDV